MHLLLLTYFLALASAGCNSAAPAASSSAASTTDTANTNTANTNTATKNTITEAQILAIAPGSKSCDGAQYKDECATAKVAAEFISKSFDTYKVTSKAEQAAIIGLMAFESGDFKQNINRNSGLAGQGTRNMQSPTFNEKYANSLSGDIKTKAMSETDPAKRLLVLTSDREVDFGSGAWFLTKVCPEKVRTALAKGDEAGWKSYTTDPECVGTTLTDKRKDYWQAAVKALGK